MTVLVRLASTGQCGNGTSMSAGRIAIFTPTRMPVTAWAQRAKMEDTFTDRQGARRHEPPPESSTVGSPTWPSCWPACAHQPRAVQRTADATRRRVGRLLPGPARPNGAPGCQAVHDDVRGVVTRRVGHPSPAGHAGRRIEHRHRPPGSSGRLALQHGQAGTSATGPTRPLTTSAGDEIATGLAWRRR